MAGIETGQNLQRDISSSEQEKQEPGLELVKGEELDGVVEATSDLAGKMERDEKITGDDVLKLDEALGKVRVNVGGEMMTIDEVKNIPDLQENLKLFDEILRGSIVAEQHLTFITLKIASLLINNESRVSIDIYLETLEEISDEVVLLLSQSELNLFLDKIRYLSDKALQYLLDRKEGLVSLRGLRDLSDHSIELLRNYSKNNIIVSRLIKEKMLENKK